MSGAEHKVGDVCWVELTTTDAGSAGAFYKGLFDWTGEANEIPGGGVYNMLSLNNGLVGALFEMDSVSKAKDVGASWMLYVTVENADATAAQVKSLGGTVVKDAFDVMDAGRMAVIKGPSGAECAVWQANQHTGMAHTDGKPGTLCWAELMSDAVARDGSFYSALFGWTLAAHKMGDMTYTSFMNGERGIGGMMPMDGDEWKGMAAHWMTYFAVQDCDASSAKVAELGGKVCVPAFDIPSVGRVAVCDDPQGGTFSIIKLAPKE